MKEGRKLHIPIVALTDTNCDPDMVDFIIPGNDDAIRSIKLITSRVADACLEGQTRRREFAQGGGEKRLPHRPTGLRLSLVGASGAGAEL